MPTTTPPVLNGETMAVEKVESAEAADTEADTRAVETADCAETTALLAAEDAPARAVEPADWAEESAEAALAEALAMAEVGCE